jgi:hypothetical protein
MPRECNMDSCRNEATTGIDVIWATHSAAQRPLYPNYQQEATLTHVLLHVCRHVYPSSKLAVERISTWIVSEN